MITNRATHMYLFTQFTCDHRLIMAIINRNTAAVSNSHRHIAISQRKWLRRSGVVGVQTSPFTACETFTVLLWRRYKRRLYYHKTELSMEHPFDDISDDFKARAVLSRINAGQRAACSAQCASNHPDVVLLGCWKGFQRYI